MKNLALLMVPLVCAAAATDVDGLVEAARGAPAEFSADALIRLAATDQLETGRRVELLEEAFRRAGGAEQAYPRYAVAVRLDGSSRYWNRVYGQGLDTLSLELRAVDTMLPLDANKARALFLRIPPPRFPALKCTDFLVYDAGRFYDVLGRVARQAFDAKETEESGLEILRKYAGTMTSAVQAGPMARVLAGAPETLKNRDFENLLGTYATALGKIRGDDRSFTFAAALGKDIQALVEVAKRRQVRPLLLLEQYRLYLVVNLSGERCADGDQMLGGQQAFAIVSGAQAEQNTSPVAFFNDKLRMPPLAALQELEVTPSRLEGTIEEPHQCEDTECQAFMADFRELVFGANGIPLPLAQRNTPEWQAKLKERLAAVAEWKPEKGASGAQYFREKSGAYGELLNLAQNGPNRELVQRAWLGFVKGNSFEKSNRVEWFLPVNGLIGRVSLDPAGLGRFGEDLRKSDDPLIRLYANLEAAAPRTAERILPLL